MLTTAEIAPHVHDYTKRPQAGLAFGGNPNYSAGLDVINQTEDGTINGLAANAHNNMQPTTFMNVMIKL